MLDVARVAQDGAVMVGLLVVLGLALRRAELAPPKRGWIWAGTAVVLLAWYVVISSLALQDTFKASLAVRVPAIPFAVLGPLLIAFVLLSRSAVARALVDATPLWWLVAIQIYRVVGVEFLLLWAQGGLPAVFAVPAGLGDIATGLLTIPVAWWARRDPQKARPAALAWNAIGILDFFSAMATGFLSSPGKLQVLALDQPNLLASVYPLVMIPTFLVPLSFILHGICLWKIARLSERRRTAQVLAASA
ncbi:hypothetical protein [Bradyrhizobium sp. STM 3809]|uniref:hypothetical protein n=1 Tax=Bradyrhizobium sp. STM 3809 TaxID=551936 RepID=UPI0002409324|nr:hypothetical protein [Bradyrhizobium sp. STM 3809]CCE01185.1 putative Major facilitator superfamily (MFS_1) transporter [Bradyrhizobium sp. STM 3809]